MTIVIKEQAEYLLSVGRNVPLQTCFNNLRSYVGFGILRGNELTFVMNILKDLGLDIKLKTTTIQGDIDVSVQIVDPKDRNPLGVGIATNANDAALAAFYDFFH